jgi:excisionase family DNA binding protein
VGVGLVADLWTVEAIADYLQVSRPTAYRTTLAEGFPAPVWVGKRKRWRPEEVKEWAGGLGVARHG